VNAKAAAEGRPATAVDKGEEGAVGRIAKERKEEKAVLEDGRSAA